jgi:hypothetical protein
MHHFRNHVDFGVVKRQLHHTEINIFPKIG